MGNLKPGYTRAYTQTQPIFASTKRIHLIYQMLTEINVRSWAKESA